MEILNGGAGDDTYSFTLGDGSDIINEAAASGAADRISILAPIDTVSGLGLLTGLNAADNNASTTTGDLVISYTMLNGTTPVTQNITVAGHFTGTNAQTGVERINFNSATYAGYLLGPDDYLISRSDPGNRDSGGVNLSASTVNNFIVGENGGVDDEITGGLGNDLIFGGTGDNEIAGGAGDDLLVGGSETGDDDLLDGGLDADTMVGLAGNDTYIVDDLLDVVVEAAGQGTDTVQTLMAALSIELMANVENLTYTGADADPFVGTGNTLANVISGGDLADTLSGLDGNDTLNGGADNDTLIGGLGNDTLNGGAGADTMRGGAGDDVYDVDDAGDVVDEVTAGSTGTDRVESDINYVLGANLENLDLNNDAANGTGNELNNVINGNDAANQLFGGAGNDTLSGGDGNDVLDGGIGNDTISGGDDNDTIIGGEGDDTIDVGGGVNTIIYSALGFGNDTINSFDATGGTPATQDRIDLSGLGITAADFAQRVLASTVSGNTLLNIRDASLTTTIGTIQINGVTSGNITVTDFTLAVAAPLLPGATAGNDILNGTANADTINALAGNDTVNGGAGNDVITGGTGTDTLNGDAGDDTISWSATGPGGRDIVNGGTEGGAGDTFVVNGTTGAEVFRIYTRAAWDAVDGNSLSSLNGATEIVITRNGTNNASVIGELREIEEIRINGADPSGAGGSAGGDTFQVIGDFSGTSLRLNTVTIGGNAGNDKVDISKLVSDHSVAFTSNGGNDTIVGTLRPQDTVEGNFTSTGDALNNTLIGGSGHDTLIGKAGDDLVDGRSGNDYLRGYAGDDTIVGGLGNDNMDGGTGNDTFVFGADFGNDTIKRFDANATGGQDLLDISNLGITSANFQERVQITSNSKDTLVTIHEEGTIRLEGVNGVGTNAITESDFLVGEVPSPQDVDDVSTNVSTESDFLLS